MTVRVQRDNNPHVTSKRVRARCDKCAWDHYFVTPIDARRIGDVHQTYCKGATE